MIAILLLRRHGGTMMALGKMRQPDQQKCNTNAYWYYFFGFAAII